jgi:hypothetical protein
MPVQCRRALDWAGKNLIDTTGRLQIDEPMMAELLRLKEASRPDELLLVADAMTGQSAVDIAKIFDEKIGLTSNKTFPIPPMYRYTNLYSPVRFSAVRTDFCPSNGKAGSRPPFHQASR